MQLLYTEGVRNCSTMSVCHPLTGQCWSFPEAATHASLTGSGGEVDLDLLDLVDAPVLDGGVGDLGLNPLLDSVDVQGFLGSGKML